MRSILVMTGFAGLLLAASCLPEPNPGPEGSEWVWPDAAVAVPDAGPLNDDEPTTPSPETPPRSLDCLAGFTEIEGECALDRTSLWTVTLVSAAAPNLDGNGESWDSFGGDPDLYIHVIYGLGEVEAESSYVDDDFLPIWGEGDGEDVILEATASDLKAGFYVELRDDDGAPYAWGDDLVGACDIDLPDEAFDGEEHGLNELDLGCPRVSLRLTTLDD